MKYNNNNAIQLKTNGDNIFGVLHRFFNSVDVYHAVQESIFYFVKKNIEGCLVISLKVRKFA